ncbi:hypothetical protein MPLSOD_290154 [Mesorhizobium sp. SOD10]|nr:hypothetical protein MPLSOD_290154 [Mesorhizobium sp. SOD10]
MAGKHTVEDTELHLHAFVHRQRRPCADLTPGDVEAGRRAGFQHRQRLCGKSILGPRPLQAVDDAGERALRKMTRDRLQVLPLRLAFGRHEEIAQLRVGVAARRQFVEQACLVLGLYGVGSQPRPQRVAIADAISRQPEIHAERAAQIRQQVAGADIGEEADADLRHGELRIFGQHPMRAMEGDADAAAHDDAVDQRDIGFLEAGDAGVEPVLVGEEVDRRLAGAAGFIDVQDIAAGGKRPALGLHDDDPDARILLPGVQRLAECLDHVVRDGVERLRPGQRDHARSAQLLEADLVAAAKIHRQKIPLSARRGKEVLKAARRRVNGSGSWAAVLALAGGRAKC